LFKIEIVKNNSLKRGLSSLGRLLGKLNFEKAVE
jgi:hypothetical protein